MIECSFRVNKSKKHLIVNVHLEEALHPSNKMLYIIAFILSETGLPDVATHPDVPEAVDPVGIVAGISRRLDHARLRREDSAAVRLDQVRPGLSTSPERQHCEYSCDHRLR